MALTLTDTDGNAFLHSTLHMLKFILPGSMSMLLGYVLVQSLSKLDKQTNNIWKLTFPLIATPLVIFLILRFTGKYWQCDEMVADAMAFGMVSGIILSLIRGSRGLSSSTKLCVVDSNGKSVELCIENSDILVGDARNKIAEAFRIHPSNRVLIETGKGGFVEELSMPLIPLLISNLASTSASAFSDFFGSRTFTCYVQVLEEDKDSEDSEGSDKNNASTKIKPRNLISMLNPRVPVKYGEDYQITAKLPASNGDSKSFHVQSVDKFLAASVSSSNSLSAIRFASWSGFHMENTTHRESDTFSDIGSDAPTNRKAPSHLSKLESITNILKRPVKEDGKPIHNGDLIIMECEKKYLSVTRGWWLAWSSSTPRRSGAFLVEVVERSPRININLKDTINKRIAWPSISLGTAGAMGSVGVDALGAMGTINTESLLQSTSPRDKEGRNAESGLTKSSSSSNLGVSESREKDTSVLHVGDIFRLRSVKFPEFELGITSEHLRDDFCYLGLRKVKDKETDTWCLPLRFSVRPAYSTADMFTTRVATNT